MAEAFLNHTRREPTKILSNEFGRRFVFEGPLETPDGRDPSVRSVWQETQENGFAHLVTAVPLIDR